MTKITNEEMENEMRFKASRPTTEIMTQINDKKNHELGELLAVIHRDGGHYTEENGLEQSLIEAQNKVCFAYAEVERLKEQNKELRLALITRDGNLTNKIMSEQLAALKKQVEEMKNVITAHLESMNKWASIDARGMTQCTETLLKLKEALQK